MQIELRDLVWVFVLSSLAIAVLDMPLFFDIEMSLISGRFKGRGIFGISGWKLGPWRVSRGVSLHRVDFADGGKGRGVSSDTKKAAPCKKDIRKGVTDEGIRAKGAPSAKATTVHLLWSKRSSVWEAGRFVLRRVELEKLEWFTAIGLGDAAATGLAIGLIWALKGNILVTTQALTGISPRSVRIEVYPDFLSSRLDVYAHLRFRITPLNLVRVGCHVSRSGVSTAIKEVGDRLEHLSRDAVFREGNKRQNQKL